MFAILFEVLLIEIQEEIHHFAGWQGGGVKGHKNSEQNICEQTGVSYQYPRSDFQGLCGGHGGGQQQCATQTLRVHLLGIDNS